MRSDGAYYVCFRSDISQLSRICRPTGERQPDIQYLYISTAISHERARKGEESLSLCLAGYRLVVLQLSCPAKQPPAAYYIGLSQFPDDCRVSTNGEVSYAEHEKAKP